MIRFALLAALVLLVPSPRSPSMGGDHALRDPEIFRAGVFSGLLNTLSFDTDVRIMVARAELGRVSLTKSPIETIGSRRQNQPAADKIVLADLIVKIGRSAGMDPHYLLKVAGRESHLNPLARAPRSSAAGLFQFTDNTWLCTLRAFGTAYGIAGTSVIEADHLGRCRVRSAEERTRLLSLRLDPVASTQMAAALSLENYDSFQRQFARRPSATELYALHFMGRGKGLEFIRALAVTPSVQGISLAGEEAWANPSIFFTRGHAISVAEVLDRLAL